MDSSDEMFEWEGVGRIRRRAKQEECDKEMDGLAGEKKWKIYLTRVEIFR